MAHSERQTNSPANLRMRCDAKCQQFPDKPRTGERKAADNVEEGRLKEADSDKESLCGEY